MATVEAPLPGQYSISRRGNGEVPDGFAQETFEGWNVTFDTDLTASSVIVGGETIGLVVGETLDIDHRGPNCEIRLDGVPSQDSTDAIVRVQSRLIGRYVGLTDADGGLRVFTDPAGTLPVVYDDEQEFIAASPLSIPTVSQRTHFRERFYEEIRSPGSSWLPGTRTYYRGVKRLLPNHYLDTATWRTDRYWPAENVERRPNTGSGTTIERIVADLGRVLESIVNHYSNPELGFTAGKDSRSLLAVARSWARTGTMALYTYDNEQYAVDVHVARKITTDHHLDWTPVRPIEATPSERERYLRRTGYCVSTAAKAIHPTIQELDVDARIGGMGGEIGRGYYWRVSDDARTEIDVVELLDRFQRPHHRELVDDLEDWLREVDDFDYPTTLDLAYQEHRLGCWGGPQQLGILEDSDYFAPYCFLPIIESIHELTPDVRTFDELPHEVIHRTWRELDAYPYNSYSGWQRWRNLSDDVQTVKAAIANPRAAVRYLARNYR